MDGRMTVHDAESETGFEQLPAVADRILPEGPERFLIQQDEVFQILVYIRNVLGQACFHGIGAASFVMVDEIIDILLPEFSAQQVEQILPLLFRYKMLGGILILHPDDRQQGGFEVNQREDFLQVFQDLLF